MPKRVLITGTSTGFGRDAAERLARRGDQVFATMRDVEGRNAEHREALERLATQEGLRLRVLALDVTDQASVDSAVAATLAEAGGLDVVINNAGVAAIGITEAFTPQQFEQVFDVNVYGVVRVNRYADRFKLDIQSDVRNGRVLLHRHGLLKHGSALRRRGRVPIKQQQRGLRPFKRRHRRGTDERHIHGNYFHRVGNDLGDHHRAILRHRYGGAHDQPSGRVHANNVCRPGQELRHHLERLRGNVDVRQLHESRRNVVPRDCARVADVLDRIGSARPRAPG
jgi:hypothetical protein